MLTEDEKNVVADSLILLERLMEKRILDEERRGIVQMGPSDGISDNYGALDYLNFIARIRAKLGRL